MKAVERHRDNRNHSHQTTLGIPGRQRRRERHRVRELIHKVEYRQRYQAESMEDPEINQQERRGKQGIDQRVLRADAWHREQQRKQDRGQPSALEDEPKNKKEEKNQQRVGKRGRRLEQNHGDAAAQALERIEVVQPEWARRRLAHGGFDNGLQLVHHPR